MGEDFAKKVADIMAKIKELPSRLPDIVKGEGLQFIADNFKRGGFEKAPGQIDKWKERKPAKGKKAKHNSRAPLVKTGQLRRSWDTESHTGPTSAIFQSSRPYAEAHNDGEKAGRPPGFTMPQRQMIGPSKALDQRIEIKIDREIDRILD